MPFASFIADFVESQKLRMDDHTELLSGDFDAQALADIKFIAI